MAVPWKTANKLIVRSSYTSHRLPKKSLLGFVPPPDRPSLSFTPTLLFASMARTTALRNASPGIRSALYRGAAAVTEAVVDDSGASFDVTADLLQLADAERTTFSGRVGAGICDIYMNEVGYVWRDNAASLLAKKRSQHADFVYEGGSASSHGVVLAEAKGSFARHTSAITIRGQTEKGYTDQVQPHIGATMRDGTQVVHGYAVGVGAVPGRPGAFLHVSETGFSPVASPGRGPITGKLRAKGSGDDGSGGGRLFGGSGGRGTPPSGPDGGAGAGGRAPMHMERAHTRIALGNYRAVFELAGARSVVSIIDAILNGRRLEEPVRRGTVESFTPISYGGRTYISGVQDDRWPSWHAPESGRFAIVAAVAIAFLSRLRDLTTGAADIEGHMDLPVVDVSFGSHGRDSTEPVVFRDGLSLFPYGRDELRHLNPSPVNPLDSDRERIHVQNPKWSYIDGYPSWGLEQGFVLPRVRRSKASPSPAVWADDVKLLDELKSGRAHVSSFVTNSA